MGYVVPPYFTALSLKQPHRVNQLCPLYREVTAALFVAAAPGDDSLMFHTAFHHPRLARIPDQLLIPFIAIHLF